MTVNFNAIRALQAEIGQANKAKGFRDDLDEIKALIDDIDNGVLSGTVPADVQGVLLKSLYAGVRGYLAEKLLLIVSEVSEAHDEIRTGHAVNQTYFPTRGNPDIKPGQIMKPEGLPSELADVVIRAFDFADEFEIDLAEIMQIKLDYNATRPFKHGKKF